MENRVLTIVTVTLSDREDGGVGVSSEELPGLIMSGADREAVLNALPTAIKMLFEHGGVETVTVVHNTPVAEILHRQLPADLDMHVHRFVVEILRAA